MSLDVEAAKAAVQTVADAMDLSLEQAADGILRIVNENMAGALRVISVQRGHDPREFAMVAFGGAGPLHANAVAALMGSFPVIVPPSPGLLCALGDLVAGFRNEFAQTLIRRTADTTDEELREILSGLEARAREWMETQGIAAGDQHVEFVADMRYHGQGYEIPVPWGTGLEETFNDLHEQLYGFRMPNTASEIVNLRAVGTGDRPRPELPEQMPTAESFGPGTYARADLHPGAIITGPSIITEFDSTTVVLEGYVAEIDRYFNILITEEQA
jgi:N-methylhydantoinase A